MTTTQNLTEDEDMVDEITESEAQAAEAADIAATRFTSCTSCGARDLECKHGKGNCCTKCRHYVMLVHS